MKTRVFLLSWLTGATLLLALPIATAEPVDCHVGLYRLSDASMVDIAPAGDGALRWRRLDGTTGLLTQRGKTNWISTLGSTGRVDGKVASFSACFEMLRDYARFGVLKGTYGDAKVTQPGTPN